MKLTPEEELEKFKEELLFLRKVEMVIVEGANDRKALKIFKVKRIITLGQPRYKVIEICKKEVAIITDLDAEGKRIYAQLRSEFSRRGVKINNRFRKFLFKYTRLRQIEGLETYINHLRQKAKYD